MLRLENTKTLEFEEVWAHEGSQSTKTPEKGVYHHEAQKGWKHKILKFTHHENAGNFRLEFSSDAEKCLKFVDLRRVSQSPEFILEAGAACQSNTTKLFGLMSVVLLVRPQAGGVCAHNRLHKRIPDGLIPNRVTDYTPRMVTQKNVFRINCVMIPDSMVVNLLSHSELLWRPPRADIIFLGFTGISLLKNRGRKENQ